MPVDLTLDDGDTFIKAEAADFMLDSAARRKSASRTRRALVHDPNDGLTINYAGDYPGGVTLVGVTEIYPQPGEHFTSDLIVRGGISYEVETLRAGGGGKGPVKPGELGPVAPIGRVTVSLADEIGKLHAVIAELTAKVAALEAIVHP